MAAQDLGRLGGAVAGFDRDDGAAGLEFALVVLGLVLGHARADQGAEQPDDAGTDRRVREDHPQRARRDRGADDRDHPGQHAEAGERTQPQPGQDTRHGARFGV